MNGNGRQALSKNEQNLVTMGLSPEQSVFIEIINDVPWFLAQDVCDILGLGNNREAVRKLDDDEKLTSVVMTSGQGRNMNFVNESGLYNLIFQSRKPEAKAFRKLVTDVILPSIRKFGFYIPGATGIEGKLMDVPFDYFGEGKRKAYQYRVGMRALGLNPHSGYANSRIKEYPDEFFKSEGIWYICESFLKLLSMSHVFRQSIKPLKDKIRRLPPMGGMIKAVNQLDLFSQLNEVSILSDVAMIENKELRERLVRKITGGTYE